MNDETLAALTEEEAQELERLRVRISTRKALLENMKQKVRRLQARARKRVERERNTQ